MEAALRAADVPVGVQGRAVQAAGGQVHRRGQIKAALLECVARVVVAGFGEKDLGVGAVMGQHIAAVQRHPNRLSLTGDDGRVGVVHHLAGAVLVKAGE